jgi:DNA-binding XRE family transcriptional regulator
VTRKERIAEEWRIFRWRHKLSQDGLAKILGITRYTVSNVERCLNNPQKRTLNKFAVLKGKYARKGAAVGALWRGSEEGNL